MRVAKAYKFKGKTETFADKSVKNILAFELYFGFLHDWYRALLGKLLDRGIHVAVGIITVPNDQSIRRGAEQTSRCCPN